MSFLANLFSSPTFQTSLICSFLLCLGCVTLSSTSLNASSISPPKSVLGDRADGTLVITGGGGYVDFRKGDLGATSPEEKKVEQMKQSQSTLQKSHVIVWQLTHS